MSEIHHNWYVLNEMEVTAEAHISGAWLRVSNLDPELALRLGHALTQDLDSLTGQVRMRHMN